MDCAEKLLELTIFFYVYTKSPYNSGLESPWRKERFKPILEFKYQTIVLSIKFRKCFATFMIPIALFKKFLS